MDPVDPVIRMVPERISLIAVHHATAGALVRPGDQCGCHARRLDAWSRGSSARPYAVGATPPPADGGDAGRRPPARCRARCEELAGLDCDTLIVAGDDLRITVYTAEPGTQDAERLALAVVLGTQSLID